MRDFDALEAAVADGGDEGGAFDQFVAGGGEDTALGHRFQPVAAAADALEGGGDGAGGADLADEIHGADVNAEFERGGGDDGAQFTALKAAFGTEAGLAGKAAVVSDDLIRAEALAEGVGDAFGEAAGVDEHESGAVREDEVGDAIVEFGPGFIARDGGEFIPRHFDGDVQGATVAGINEAGGGAEEAADLLDRLDGGGKPDALRADGGEGFEAGHGEREVSAAFVTGNGMDLVDDEGARRAQHPAGALRGQQDVQGFGSGDEDVGRLAAHLLPLPGGGVTGADSDVDGRERDPLLFGEVRDFLEREFEVPVDVVAESLQRGDVDRVGFGGESVITGGTHESIEAEQEGRERLAGTGGSADEGIPAGRDFGPAADLGFGRLAEPSGEPLADERIEGGEHDLISLCRIPGLRITRGSGESPSGGRGSGGPSTSGHG